MNKHRALHDLLLEAQLLSNFLERDAPHNESVEPLIDRYLDFKSASAQALRVLTDDDIATEDWALDAVLERLESELRARLADVVPLQFVVVKRYGHTHRKLYEYLWQHRGASVSATRLRVLTGDQVHTERRVRELRDIGLRILAAKRGGQNVYELTDATFDIDLSLQRFLPEFVRSVPGWTPAQRTAVLERCGVA